MASWKKVIVSGSSAEFAHVSSSGNLDVVGTISAAAINGTLGGALTDGNGIADFTFNGSANATVALDLNGSTLNLGSSGVKVADAGITAPTASADPPPPVKPLPATDVAICVAVIPASATFTPDEPRMPYFKKFHATSNIAGRAALTLGVPPAFSSGSAG